MSEPQNLIPNLNEMMEEYTENEEDANPKLQLEDVHENSQLEAVHENRPKARTETEQSLDARIKIKRNAKETEQGQEEEVGKKRK